MTNHSSKKKAEKAKKAGDGPDLTCWASTPLDAYLWDVEQFSVNR